MNVLLLAVNINQIDFNDQVEELKQLTEALNYHVEKVVIQNLPKPTKTYLGTGKLLEIQTQLDNIDMIICNDELSPFKLSYLEDFFQLPVLDRTDLILQIFELRAKTKEAKLQVKCAKLEYALPRLKGNYDDLYSQLKGSNFRGKGESQIEIDRRHIYEEIARTKRELKKLKQERQIQRKQRNQYLNVSLVGYTNSGKSTLLNLFTNKKVYVENMVFATLETSSRLVSNSHNQWILNDTVGFISHLPTHLVEAFLSTLESIQESDLIVLVIDASKDIDKQIKTTLDTLKQLNVDKPIIYIYNKKDLVNELIERKNPSIYISATNPEAKTQIEAFILEHLKIKQKYILSIPYYEDYRLHELKKEGIIDYIEYKDTIEIGIYLDKGYEKKYKDYLL